MADPIRLVCVEPALAQYRVPVFRELAQRPGIRLKVVFGDSPGERSVDPDGFEAEFVAMPRLRLGSRSIYWHSPQVCYATRRHADVLCLDGNLHSASLIPALIRARSARVPTILWGHGYSKREATWRTRARTAAMRLAAALLFYNQSAAEKHVNMGFSRDRVFVAPNSLDQEPIQRARDHWLSRPNELEQLRRTHNLIPGPMILFVSRLHPDNRLDLLLEALVLLLPDHPATQIAIVGRGDEEQRRLQDLAVKLRIEPHVRFLGAIYDESALAPWFLSARVFCYPANIGLSLLHAFGYGVPVVTSDRIEAQNPEIEALRDGVNGRLYRAGDASSLASVLDELLSNPSRAAELGDQARQTALDRYTIPIMVDGFERAVRYCAAKMIDRSRSRD